MSDLCLSFLGSPDIRLDGQSISLKNRKAVALLAYLTVEGKAIRRDALATFLWPEKSQRKARANLRHTLWVIGHTVGAQWLAADRETVCMRREANCRVDVVSFLDLLQTRSEDDFTESETIARLQSAVDLYHGDFLAGFTLSDSSDFDEWQSTQYERLRHSLSIALRQLVCHYKAQEQYEHAIASAQRWLALDRLHEPAHRWLMKLYAFVGQQSAALRQYQLIVQALDEELGVSPSVESTTLYERIRNGDFDRTGRVYKGGEETVGVPDYRAPRPNLPVQVTPFIGREAELAELDGLLNEAMGRLVTIVGAGGMGKTRLALAVAEAQLESARFPQGVFFVSLASVNEVEHLVPAIAEAVGYSLEPEGQIARSTKEQLLNYLRDRQLLLVLDNFEHLLSGVGLVADILQIAPQLRILVTSRERLYLHGEQLFPLQGLEFPSSETPADVATYTAVKLFIQSARRVQPHFAPSADDAYFLIHICRLVEGMPLAIELAAGWVDLLSLADIEVEIQSSLDILETTAHNAPDHLRSMRAVFNRSWERLGMPEQQIVARISVFRGGFTRHAALTVADASLRLLSLLSNKSLLQYDQAADRYQIHELLRQYAAEKLESAGKTELVRDAHVAYFAGFLKQKEVELKGHGQRQAKSEIGVEFENVRRAWLWALERKNYSALNQAMEGLYWFLHHDLQRYHAGQALFQIGRECLASSENEAPHPTWGKILARIMPYGSGEFEKPMQAKAWLEQALAIAETHGDEAEQAFCHWVLSRIRLTLAEFDSVIVSLKHSLRYYRTVGDRFYIAWTLQILGQAHIRLRDRTSAIAYLQQSLRLFDELGVSPFPVLVLLGLTLSAHAGDFEQGEAHLRRAYHDSQTEGNLSNMAGALIYLSRALSVKGDFENAKIVVLEALALAEENYLEYRQLQARMDLGLRAYERGNFEQALHDLSWVQDRATTPGNQIRIEVILGLTMIQLNKGSLRPYLVSRLHGPVSLAMYNLPLVALHFKQTGNVERATRLLALFTLHDRLSYLARLGNMSEFQSLKESLAAALPPEVFDAAWEQGQSLNLATTLTALAQELSQPNWTGQ